jgi:hypothetical protein
MDRKEIVLVVAVSAAIALTILNLYIAGIIPVERVETDIYGYPIIEEECVVIANFVYPAKVISKTEIPNIYDNLFHQEVVYVSRGNAIDHGVLRLERLPTPIWDIQYSVDVGSLYNSVYVVWVVPEIFEAFRSSDTPIIVGEGDPESPEGFEVFYDKESRILSVQPGGGIRILGR